MRRPAILFENKPACKFRPTRKIQKKKRQKTTESKRPRVEQVPCLRIATSASSRPNPASREAARSPMASSEIEVVDDTAAVSAAAAAEGGVEPAVASGASQEGEEEALKDDVYTGAAYGDLEKLHRLVEREGRSVAEADALGYHALQWAALNNRVAAAQYILEVWLPTILLGARRGRLLGLAADNGDRLLVATVCEECAAKLPARSSVSSLLLQ